MTGAYASNWPGAGPGAEQWGRGCGPKQYGRHGGGGERGRHGDPSEAGRHGGGGRHGAGRGGRSGRPEGPGVALEALMDWAMARGKGPHGPGRHGPNPEDLERLEQLIALRRMRGRGPSRGGGRGRGRGRARRGDVRLAVLRLLSEEPRNGYQLMQTIEERSDGRWRPSPGSMYPTLSQLEDEGLIRSTESDGARRYEITDAGRADLENRTGEPDPWIPEPDADENAMSELGPLVIGIGKAVWQVASVADETQRAKAVALLAETRRSLYGILAEEPAADSAPDSGATGDSADAEG